MGRLRLRFQATQQSLSDPSPWGDSLRLFEPKINGAFGVGGGIRKPGGTFGEFWGPTWLCLMLSDIRGVAENGGQGSFQDPPK